MKKKKRKKKKLGRPRKIGRPRKKKKTLKSKKHYQRKLKKAIHGRKRSLPPRVKTGKNKGQFRKRKR